MTLLVSTFFAGSYFEDSIEEKREVLPIVKAEGIHFKDSLLRENIILLERYSKLDERFSCEDSFLEQINYEIQLNEFIRDMCDLNRQIRTEGYSKEMERHSNEMHARYENMFELLEMLCDTRD